MNVKELIEHLEKQIDAKDAREPNAQWILNELRNYIDDKESCQWCGAKVEGRVLVDLGDGCQADVCQACAYDYAMGKFDHIKKKIKEKGGQ